jgi:DNA ligase-1
MKTLYQKTNTGAIQEWSIAVVTENEYPTILTTWGQVNGAKQTTTDIIKSGKNEGKANATSALEQAQKEALARWVKQKKKGYVESIESAQTGEVDSDVVLGGIEPMLAPNKSYPKDSELQKRIEFPCFIQPKLDGMRCIAVIENGVCTLWSRTRKPINTVPHIVASLEERFKATSGRLIFDGELYNHVLCDDFEELISILRKDEPDQEGKYKQIEYHVYDTVMSMNFSARSTVVKDSLKNLQHVVIVPTCECLTLEDLDKEYIAFCELGYEGAMARNGSSPYEEGKRSVHLQKMKPFQDDEFPIIGINEGRGKDAGTVATFTCLTHDGKEFYPRLKATYKYRTELFNDETLWKGKKLTVTLKRYTADGIPYLPIGKTIRDYE